MRTAPGVFRRVRFVMMSRIVKMEAMRTLMLAKKGVSHITLRERLSSSATVAVVYGGVGPAQLRHSPYVRMADTWLNPFVIAHVLLHFQVLRTHIVGHVPMATKCVSF